MILISKLFSRIDPERKEKDLKGFILRILMCPKKQNTVEIPHQLAMRSFFCRMKIKYNKYFLRIVVLGFVLVLLMRFVLGWCNIWVCVSGIGLIIVWQIASDFYDENEDDTI